MTVDREGTNMKRIGWLVIAFLLVAGTAGAQDIRYNYDKSADFTSTRLISGWTSRPVTRIN